MKRAWPSILTFVSCSCSSLYFKEGLPAAKMINYYQKLQLLLLFCYSQIQCLWFFLYIRQSSETPFSRRHLVKRSVKPCLVAVIRGPISNRAKLTESPLESDYLSSFHYIFYLQRYKHKFELKRCCSIIINAEFFCFLGLMPIGSEFPFCCRSRSGSRSGSSSKDFDPHADTTTSFHMLEN
jgi:hypothetical protein